MRIASLIPSATEALFALGLGSDVVAVTHECDFPAEVETLPRLTASVLPPDLPPAEIDARVRDLTARGEAIYRLDTELLARLQVDLIVTQALCAVCAVSYDEVCAISAELPSDPRVLSLDPMRLDEVLDDVVRIADAAGDPQAGAALRRGLEGRLDAVRTAATAAVETDGRPRVAALEWLDPPYLGGHWVPEMVELAGGRDVLGTAGDLSHTADWSEIADARPDVVVVMPCGYDASRAAFEAMARRAELAALGASRAYAVDAAASFSRPGPRLVDGVELLGHLLHPEHIPAPPGVGHVDL